MASRPSRSVRRWLLGFSWGLKRSHMNALNVSRRLRLVAAWSATALCRSKHDLDGGQPGQP